MDAQGPAARPWSMRDGRRWPPLHGAGSVLQRRTLSAGAIVPRALGGAAVVVPRRIKPPSSTDDDNALTLASRPW